MQDDDTYYVLGNGILFHKCYFHQNLLTLPKTTNRQPLLLDEKSLWSVPLVQRMAPVMFNREPPPFFPHTINIH